MVEGFYDHGFTRFELQVDFGSSVVVSQCSNAFSAAHRIKEHGAFGVDAQCDPSIYGVVLHYREKIDVSFPVLSSHQYSAQLMDKLFPVFIPKGEHTVVVTAGDHGAFSHFVLTGSFEALHLRQSGEEIPKLRPTFFQVR